MSYLLLFKNIAIAFRLNSLLNIILTFIYQHTAYTLIYLTSDSENFLLEISINSKFSVNFTLNIRISCPVWFWSLVCKLE